MVLREIITKPDGRWAILNDGAGTVELQIGPSVLMVCNLILALGLSSTEAVKIVTDIEEAIAGENQK